jgi:hypothetical protein
MVYIYVYIDYTVVYLKGLHVIIITCSDEYVVTLSGRPLQVVESILRVCIKVLCRYLGMICIYTSTHLIIDVAVSTYIMH